LENKVKERFVKINKELPDTHFTASLQDLASIMVTSKQSLDTLSIKLIQFLKFNQNLHPITNNFLAHSNLIQNHIKPIQSKTFRGNIQIDTFDNKPWQEEKWSEIFIGENNSKIILKNFMRCVRCISTTIDPDTGKFRKDFQPLKYLPSHLMYLHLLINF